jgi:hypothetical protein
MIFDFFVNSLPPFVLLIVIWTSLTIFYFFIRSQINKEKFNLTKYLNNVKDTQRLTEEEIDQLAIYVSHLPRPKDLLKKLDLDEEENK